MSDVAFEMHNTPWRYAMRPKSLTLSRTRTSKSTAARTELHTFTHTLRPVSLVRCKVEVSFQRLCTKKDTTEVQSRGQH